MEEVISMSGGGRTLNGVPKKYLPLTDHRQGKLVQVPQKKHKLTTIEEVVQQTLVAEQVEGVEGIDTAEATLENEGKSD